LLSMNDKEVARFASAIGGDLHAKWIDGGFGKPYSTTFKLDDLKLEDGYSQDETFIAHLESAQKAFMYEPEHHLLGHVHLVLFVDHQVVIDLEFEDCRISHCNHHPFTNGVSVISKLIIEPKVVCWYEDMPINVGDRETLRDSTGRGVGSVDAVSPATTSTEDDIPTLNPEYHNVLFFPASGTYLAMGDNGALSRAENPDQCITFGLVEAMPEIFYDSVHGPIHRVATDAPGCPYKYLDRNESEVAIVIPLSMIPKNPRELIAGYRVRHATQDLHLFHDANPNGSPFFEWTCEEASELYSTKERTPLNVFGYEREMYSRFYIDHNREVGKVAAVVVQMLKIPEVPSVIKPKGPSHRHIEAPIQVVEACRDSGGELKCRECSRIVDRQEDGIHFIEDGACDCPECYHWGQCDRDLESESERWVIRCVAPNPIGRQVRGSYVQITSAVFQYVDLENASKFKKPESAPAHFGCGTYIRCAPDSPWYKHYREELTDRLFEIVPYSMALEDETSDTE